MVRLLLMRHAEAKPHARHEADFFRDLTESGREVARQTGTLLKSLRISCDRILASAARRTMETADIVIESAGWPLQPEEDPELYNASAHGIRHRLRAAAAQADQAILLVGHNPGIGMLICELAGSSLEVPPGTLAVFTADTFEALLPESPVRVPLEFLVIGGQRVPAQEDRTVSRTAGF